MNINNLNFKNHKLEVVDIRWSTNVKKGYISISFSYQGGYYDIMKHYKYDENGEVDLKGEGFDLISANAIIELMEGVKREIVCEHENN